MFLKDLWLSSTALFLIKLADDSTSVDFLEALEFLVIFAGLF